MFIPSYNQLSDEQVAVYMGAAQSEPTLVMGPPGSGKTLLAFFKAENIAKRNRRPQIIMFNKVLSHYTKALAERSHLSGNVSTWHKWFYGWWKSAFQEPVPEKEQYHFDWVSILQKIGSASPSLLRKYAWDHLLIDEGQDLPSQFYLMIQLFRERCRANGIFPPAITVFADENQRLWDANSTLKEISDCLDIPTDRQYMLTRNYRNTAQIADVAARFSVGLSTGVAVAPTNRAGDIPLLLRTNTHVSAVSFIARYARINEGKEIGVIAPNIDYQLTFYRGLLDLLADDDVFRVQTFVTGNKNYSVHTLVFGKGSTLTVLNPKTCKGLEFDSVFIPEVQSLKWDPANAELNKMELYVMITRARNYLCFSYTAENGTNLDVLDLLNVDDGTLVRKIETRN